MNDDVKRIDEAVKERLESVKEELGLAEIERRRGVAVGAVTEATRLATEKHQRLRAANATAPDTEAMALDARVAELEKAAKPAREKLREAREAFPPKLDKALAKEYRALAPIMAEAVERLADVSVVLHRLDTWCFHNGIEPRGLNHPMPNFARLRAVVEHLRKAGG